MKNTVVRPNRRFIALAFLCSVVAAQAGGYTNLSIAVYFRYQEVHSIPSSLDRFSNQWANVEKQVRVDKVYLETTRNAQLATESDVTTMKKFFADRGIKTSAGLGLTANEPNGFQSYCYSTPADREKVKAMTEFTARHFDEIILDDFFFSNCKCDRCIAAKGDQSWTRFRTEQLDDVSRDLIIGPAKAINPKVRVIIKYPNWYESFQGLGYDLAVEPKLYDAIYTGTETRDANSGQHLQSYQSYLQTQFFNNIKPGGNQGGWIDGGRDVERYAEQMWDTFFAKVPEIMLFNSMQIAAPLNTGNRGSEPDTNASLSIATLTAPIPQPDGSTYTPNMVARIAGCSAELLDRFLGKLGKPIGVATYKPCNSVGEPYLPNYLGMIGVPIDLVPEFPTNVPAIFLTAASSFDKDLVAKTRKFVRAGGRVIVTTALIEVLGEKGFQDIAEIQAAGRRVVATRFSSGRGLGAAPAPASEPDLNILLPQIRRFENDNRLVINFNTALSGYPMAVSSTYGRGTFSVLAIPDDFADLYRLPQSVLNQIRALLGRDVFVNLDAPDHVSLFAYDNRTFIVQNFRPQPVSARVSVVRAARLHDLLSGQTLAGSEDRGGQGGRGRLGGAGGSTSFQVPVPGHSFRVFAAE
ncbi:MAG: hypothetical protein ACLQVX_11800 [Limisphaerales bacterium]